ncbi:MAG: vWA domain-containing protein [Cytophagaceae bacterium]
MQGFLFSKFNQPNKGKSGFDELSKVFFQLINLTSGNVPEALNMMQNMDKQFGLGSDDYGLGDFLEELKEKGFIKENESGNLKLTSRSEQTIRRNALEEIFGEIKKTKRGQHSSPKTGQGDEYSADVRPFQYGDSLESIDFTASLHNAQVNHGIDDFKITNDDLEVQEREQSSQTATVLMIDISHSMILYGEDRITPAKKVAMALAELIKIKYPKDTLDIVVFGNDAWTIELKDLPYLQVGPYHTNTCAGLQLAMDILRKRKTANKQIFMITDGKPTCLKIGTKYYKNSFGLDRKVVNKTLEMATQCRRLNIPVTTFMIAKDPYLQEFVREFTKTNNGKAFYSSLTGLGEYVFEDFIRNRKKTYR